MFKGKFNFIRFLNQLFTIKLVVALPNQSWGMSVVKTNVYTCMILYLNSLAKLSQLTLLT